MDAAAINRAVAGRTSPVNLPVTRPAIWGHLDDSRETGTAVPVLSRTAFRQRLASGGGLVKTVFLDITIHRSPDSAEI